MSDEVDYIKTKLSETGFPLEILIHSKLQSKLGYVIHQDYYFDYEGNKTRSVDLVADLDSKPLNWHYTDPINFFMDSTLVLECKKSSKHWVFFPIKDTFKLRNGQMCSLLQRKDGFSLISEVDILSRGHQNKHPDGVASAYKVIDENKNYPNEIYEAIMQLTKYIQYNKKIILDNKMNKIKPFIYKIYFWLPIIVFDGKIWIASMINGKINEVVEVNHVILSYESKSITTNRNDSFIIDVIKPDYLDDLIDSLKQDVKEIDILLEKDKTRIIRDYNLSQ